MKILITGASGLIGSELVQELCSKQRLIAINLSPLLSVL